MRLEGVYCPVPTPFSEGSLAPDKLAENLAQWNRSELAGYVLLGSTGETPFLSNREKIRLIESARVAVPASKQLIVGTGLEATAATVAFTREVAGFGVDAVLVLTPHYYKSQMTGQALIRHYTDVADASPLPVLLYNVPMFTGLDMPAEAIVALSQHENIVGIKDSTSQIAKLEQVLEHAAPGFRVLVGNAMLFLPGLVLGAQGAILAVSSLATQLCVEICRCVQTGALEAARKAFSTVAAVAREVVTPFGIAGIKAALDLLGYYGGPPRAPLLPVTTEQKQRIREVLSTRGLIEKGQKQRRTRTN